VVRRKLEDAPRMGRVSGDGVSLGMHPPQRIEHRVTRAENLEGVLVPAAEEVPMDSPENQFLASITCR
jgi:hypothetical protein